MNELLIHRKIIYFPTLNYKDGLAVSGATRICRRLPMICGIDLAGTVSHSSDSVFRPGDRILVNGFGMSESYDGGYSQKQRVKPEWIVRVPDSLSLEEAMAIGTAGYTSMLCVQGLQDGGVEPGDGPVLVTGAAGGVVRRVGIRSGRRTWVILLWSTAPWPGVAQSRGSTVHPSTDKPASVAKLRGGRPGWVAGGRAHESLTI